MAALPKGLCLQIIMSALSIKTTKEAANTA